MRRLPFFFVIGLCFISVFFIAACAPGDTPSTVQSIESVPVVEVAAAQDVLVNTNSTVPKSNPASDSVMNTASAIRDSSSCLECHSNAELLEQLAEEEDVPEVPSEGSG